MILADFIYYGLIFALAGVILWFINTKAYGKFKKKMGYRVLVTLKLFTFLYSLTLLMIIVTLPLWVGYLIFYT